MADFIDKDIFLKDVLPECEYPAKLSAAVERQPIVHIDDMAFKIQNELQAANPSGILEVTFVRHGRWLYSGWENSISNTEYLPAFIFECSECGHEIRVTNTDLPLYKYCANCGARMDLRTPTDAALDIADSVMMGGYENG